MAIRYDKQLKNEIYKAVRSFNAKISRLEEKGVSAALLPDRISSKNIKANFGTRKQLRSYLKTLQEFTSKGQTFKSEGGVTGTTQLFQYNVKRANRATAALSRERKKLADIPTRYPMMKSENISLLESKMNYLKRDIYNLDVRQINIFKRNIESTFNRNRQNAVFHKNFKTMILSIGYRAGIDTGFLEELGNKFDKLPPNKLLELYRTNPAFGIIDFYKAEDAPDSVRDYFDSIDNTVDEEIQKIK